MDLFRWPARALGYLHRKYTRPLLPATRPAFYAGVASSFDYRVGDGLLPRRFRPCAVEDIEGYEEQLITALRAHVRIGSRVVVVGGGSGVTTTIAAKLVGQGTDVTCYEASRRQLAVIRECCSRNGVAHRVDLRFATVGTAVHVYGHDTDAGPITSPRDLPECDVLQLDCEGAELVILAEMTICPDVIFIETHGYYGSSTDAVCRLLARLGYGVTDMGVAETRFTQACLDRDIHVLVACRGK